MNWFVGKQSALVKIPDFFPNIIFPTNSFLVTESQAIWPPVPVLWQSYPTSSTHSPFLLSGPCKFFFPFQEHIQFFFKKTRIYVGVQKGEGRLQRFFRKQSRQYLVYRTQATFSSFLLCERFFLKKTQKTNAYPKTTDFSHWESFRKQLPNLRQNTFWMGYYHLKI